MPEFLARGAFVEEIGSGEPNNEPRVITGQGLQVKATDGDSGEAQHTCVERPRRGSLSPERRRR